jgi:hypothetical protein
MHGGFKQHHDTIIREPQRLRFRLPEIVQGERKQAERDQAIAAWMRTQVAPVLDRSLESVTGKPVKKPAIGLRGKYHLNYAPPRLAKHFNLQIPTRKASRLTNYRWHDYGPFNRERPVTPIEIDVAPTVLEFLPVWRGKGGYPLPPMPFPRRLPSQVFTLLPPLPRHIGFQLGLWRVRTLWGKPDLKVWAPWIREDYRQRDDLEIAEHEHDFMARWVIKPPPEREAPPPRWMRRLALRYRFVTVPVLEPYLAVLGRREVGFTLKDGCPVSTYVPYRRSQSKTWVSASIDPAAEDETSDGAYLRLLLSAGEHAELVKEERASELPEAEETNRDAWGEYLDLLHEVSGDDEDEPADLARDMGTRYYWQIARNPPFTAVLDSSRNAVWLAWRPALRKRGRPGLGTPWEKEGVSRSKWFKDRGLNSSEKVASPD